MELDRFLLLARRWRLALALAAINGALLAYYVFGFSPPVFEAHTRILVGPLSASVDVLRASSSLAVTYRDLSTSTTVLSATSQRLGLAGGAAGLRGAVRSLADTDTRLIDISVRYTDAQTAADIANVIASELQRLQASRGPVSAEGTMTVVDPAEPGVSLTPSAIIPALFGAGAATIAAGLLILLYEYRTDRIRGLQDVVSLGRSTALGSVAAMRRAGPDAPVPTLVRVLGDTPSAAVYRTIAARIVLADGWEPLRAVLVVGADEGSGAGEVAVNLASVYSGLGQRAFLLDANALEGEIVVAGATEKDLRLDDLLMPWASTPTQLGVKVEAGLSTGSLRETDTVGITRDAATRVLSRLAQGAEVVVVNAGPLLISASSLAWAAAASRTIVVARRDRTRRTDLIQAVESLAQVKADLLGIVLVAGSVRPPRGWDAAERGEGQRVRRTRRTRRTSTST